jgi:cytoskeletal protein CcmA (bactofilin family)
LRRNKADDLAQERHMFGKKGLKPTSIQTLIGEKARIEGNLNFEGGCHVDGVVFGSVGGTKANGAFLSVSELGTVEGDVDVPRLALSGTVQGNVVVSDRAEFGPTAKVIGDVYYNLIEIAAGAEINGKLIHRPQLESASVANSESAHASARLDAELEGAS